MPKEILDKLKKFDSNMYGNGKVRSKLINLTKSELLKRKRELKSKDKFAKE